MTQNAVLDNKSLNEIDNIKIKDNYTLLELTSSSWSAATFNGESCFKATKTLTGATADSHPELWFAVRTINTANDEFVAFNLIYRAVCGANNITFYAYKQPLLTISVQVKGW